MATAPSQAEQLPAGGRENRSPSEDSLARRKPARLL